MKRLAILAAVAFTSVVCGLDDNRPDRTRPTPERPTATTLAPLEIDAAPIATPSSDLPSPTAPSVTGKSGMISSPAPPALARAEIDPGCDRWARDNLHPRAYRALLELDPNDLSDIERYWLRSIVPIWECQDYWSEPLSTANADKRNARFKDTCYQSLWRLREDFLSRHEAYEYPWDQCSRMSNWLDLTGAELMKLDPKPRDQINSALESRSRGDFISPEDESSGLADLFPGIGTELSLLDIQEGRMAETDFAECLYYYPQLFTGVWIPWDIALFAGDMDDYRGDQGLSKSAATPIPKKMQTWIQRQNRPIYRLGTQPAGP